ncbi:hypothetical protein MLD38_011905 [Melastoma candidum]|uniref:Uncharacterized protein n=1 Tax=Melastoma candidum TaxID=119954 RepID=A0ACB9R8R7_9MYRT|nr:hypothetical protein MLD38_011905 [Melastoma candidum]
MVQVEVVRAETVKPSSPTPDHLRRLELSFLDQVSPPVFMPIVLFFPDDGVHSDQEKGDRIKESLSEALTLYYPLAGRVKDNLYVDCNDEGVLYVEARVRCQLYDILRDPVPKVLNEFLPVELDDVKELPVAVQVLTACLPMQNLLYIQALHL